MPIHKATRITQKNIRFVRIYYYASASPMELIIRATSRLLRANTSKQLAAVQYVVVIVMGAFTEYGDFEP